MMPQLRQNNLLRQLQTQQQGMRLVRRSEQPITGILSQIREANRVVERESARQPFQEQQMGNFLSQNQLEKLYPQLQQNRFLPTEQTIGPITSIPIMVPDEEAAKQAQLQQLIRMIRDHDALRPSVRQPTQENKPRYTCTFEDWFTGMCE